MYKSSSVSRQPKEHKSNLSKVLELTDRAEFTNSKSFCSKTQGRYCVQLGKQWQYFGFIVFPDKQTNPEPPWHLFAFKKFSGMKNLLLHVADDQPEIKRSLMTSPCK